MWSSLWQRVKDWFIQPAPELPEWKAGWSEYLRKQVSFYRWLNDEEQALFRLRIQHFLATTRVEASDSITVTDDDRLLVAASAIIPVWAFPDWHYMNVAAVYLLPGLFNERFECGMPDSHIAGLVGNGPMAGKLVLSKPHLHAGFSNAEDKHNVGIHEFAHLVDMADGSTDGFPERLMPYKQSMPWFALVQRKVAEIEKKRTGINAYGATNPAEFFAVASEYFFERPELMQRKHPELYRWLTEFYHQNRAADIRLRKHRRK